MAYITTGLTNGGKTTHYSFSYDSALGGPGGIEPARTNAAIAACENDYNTMRAWFGNSLTVTGMKVLVTTQSNGASWSGSASNSTIQLKAQGASYSGNAAYLRYLLVAEVVEIFMLTQNSGWFASGDEGSKGEGLSRFLSGQFLAQNGFLGLGIIADYSVADLWLNSTRQDFVNSAPDNNGYNATNGCTTLFIYYLFAQLGYSIGQIVGAGASTLAGVYKNLTGDSGDPFPVFKNILDLWFPSQTSSAIPGPNLDNPWPLSPVSYSGVWRAGNDPYYLWIEADQASFLNKWSTLAQQNLRLTDLEVTTLNNGQLRWAGAWEQGSDPYYLWINADRTSFVNKWTQLAQQNLRLVSIDHYNGLWAGVWRGGNDAYYLWVDADQASFLAKWSQLAQQNLRLVDFDVYTVNGQQLWAGIWRYGADPYYLWINADWNSFVSKWSQLASQGLRLTGLRRYNGLYAGIWRGGNDAYYLWANVSEASFTAKWAQLGSQGLRLVDLCAVPIGGAGPAGGSTGDELMPQRLGQPMPELVPERVASSEMFGRRSSPIEAAFRGVAAAANGNAAAAGIGEGGGTTIATGDASETVVGTGEGGGTAIVAESGGGTGGGDVVPVVARRSDFAVASPGTGGGSTVNDQIPVSGPQETGPMGGGSAGIDVTANGASSPSGGSELYGSSTFSGRGTNTHPTPA